MGKLKSSKRKTLVYILLIVAFIFATAGFKVYEDVFADNINTELDSGYIYILSENNFTLRMEAVASTGVLRNTNALKQLLQVTGYADEIKPGKYKLKKGNSNLTIMRLLVSGRQEPVKLTFKYASRVADAVRVYANKLEVDSFELLYLLSDSAYCDSLGFTTQNVISMFITNTYEYKWNTSARQLIKRLVKEYETFWFGTRDSLARAKNMTRTQIITLASIVQKETYRKSEMSTVAGVYLNRIRLNMPLQADPTILFVLNDPSIKRVSGSMLNINSPFNTYIVRGLPPGPICTPDIFTIDAVLSANNHKYIYFCAREDFSGYHNFASSFNEHLRNAAKYQRELNRKGIK